MFGDSDDQLRRWVQRVAELGPDLDVHEHTARARRGLRRRRIVLSSAVVGVVLAGSAGAIAGTSAFRDDSSGPNAVLVAPTATTSPTPSASPPPPSETPSPSERPTASPTSSPSGSPVSARRALTDYLARLAQPVAASRAVESPDGTFAVYAHDYVAVVVEYTNDRWSAVDRVSLPSPPGPADVTAAITSGFLINDQSPAFVVTGSAASVVPGSVLAKSGDAWKLVGFHSCGDPSCNGTLYEEASLTISTDGQAVTSMYDDCKPSCANGTSYTVTWTYDKASHLFEPVGRSQLRSTLPSPPH